MMMGFGGMGMAIPWLFGVLTVAAIWVGVWWLLTAMGMTAHPGNQHTLPPGAATQLPQATWQQPSFTAPEALASLVLPAPEPTPTPAQAESDHR